jgi:hypothetical protein
VLGLDDHAQRDRLRNDVCANDATRSSAPPSINFRHQTADRHATAALQWSVSSDAESIPYDVRLDLTGADEFLVPCQSPPRTDP